MMLEAETKSSAQIIIRESTNRFILHSAPFGKFLCVRNVIVFSFTPGLQPGDVGAMKYLRTVLTVCTAADAFVSRTVCAGVHQS